MWKSVDRKLYLISIKVEKETKEFKERRLDEEHDMLIKDEKTIINALAGIIDELEKINLNNSK